MHVRIPITGKSGIAHRNDQEDIGWGGSSFSVRVLARAKQSKIRLGEGALAQADRRLTRGDRQPTDETTKQFGQAVTTRLVGPANRNQIDELSSDKRHAVFWLQKTGDDSPLGEVNRRTIQRWQQRRHGEGLTLDSVRS